MTAPLFTITALGGKVRITAEHWTDAAQRARGMAEAIIQLSPTSQSGCTVTIERRGVTITARSVTWQRTFKREGEHTPWMIIEEVSA